MKGGYNRISYTYSRISIDKAKLILYNIKQKGCVSHDKQNYIFLWKEMLIIDAWSDFILRMIKHLQTVSKSSEATKEALFEIKSILDRYNDLILKHKP